MYTTLWVLKTIHDDDRSTTTIESYGDSLSEYYNYDSNVANFKQIKAGDLAILIDKKKILGFAQIDVIDQSIGLKNIKRCPECGNTSIVARKTKSPKYRCNKKHEFSEPIAEKQNVTKFSAVFKKFIPMSLPDRNLDQLKPYYTANYNRNLSMQSMSIEALNLFKEIKDKLTNED